MAIYSFAKLFFLLAVVFLAVPGAQANPSSLNVMLFQSRPRLDSVFVRAPFVMVNPIRTVFEEGLYEITDAGNGVRFKKVGGRNQKESVRAPYVVLSDRAGSTIEIGPDTAHMRTYYGSLKVSRKTGHGKKSAGLSVVNLIDSFNYVASVVGGETTAAFGKEALKA
ncbi:MAG: SpoIID/LytB domain-containing protein, partial [Candidatus Melainabacteria bacterium]|nr:SpoIID/LytB domain-containing protein [Candidatus Melainabacteria bacterium]